MNRDRRRAGIGGVPFAVSLVVGFTLFGPKGGHHSAAEVAVAGASAATLAFVRPEGISDVSPAWTPLYFAIGIAVVVTWLAQWLIRVQPRR
jgi:hypothetical protein